MTKIRYIADMENVKRSRVVNAIIYFAQHTRYCGKIKLFKLLYMLDFEHFRQTGKSVTGYEYEAWKFGPVPSALMEEWGEFWPDLAEAIHIESERVIDYIRYTVKVNDGVTFNEDDFTPRQLRIMESLVQRFLGTFSPEMIDVTHEANGAWDKVWEGGQGDHKVIPYELAIPAEAPERPFILESAKEAQMQRAAHAIPIQ